MTSIATIDADCYFFGQLLQRPIDEYAGEPFILLPRKYEISSQTRSERDVFLGEAFLRRERTDRELSAHFQVWARKEAEGDIVPEHLRVAAIAAQSLFPRNQLGIAVTAGPVGHHTLRMIVDCGALYRSNRNLDAPLDTETLAEFQDKLKNLMRAQDILATALKDQSVPSPDK